MRWDEIGAREMVLGVIFRFRCRNKSGRIYKITGLHFDDRQGNVPFCDVEACARELWTRVSRIFLLCRKETKGLSEKMEDVSGSFFKIWKFLLVTSLTSKLKG
jgi:hypothetical protein